MCGIAGMVSLDPAPAEPVCRMIAAMHHRGPDGGGICVDGAGRAAPDGPVPDGRVVLGNRRLSIVDLSPAGDQPMANENGTVWVTFNGEAYNFRELRALLEGLGHRFRSRSDTEAVVHAYEEWGPDCVHRLRGMFAFAVYDGRAVPAVFLARDRFGVKPLYYALSGGRLLFASEVRALLAGGVVGRVNPSALRSYLLFGSVAEPETLVEGVYSLPPGHRTLIRIDGASLSPVPEPYWDLAAAAQALSVNGDLPEAIRGLREVIEETVRLHLVADVPLGIFLSSGIDSMAVAALAVSSGSQVQTFTIGFHEHEFDEAGLAREFALRLGVRHQALTLTAGEMLARFDEAVGSLDQPSIDGMNTYFVSWGARQAGLKVALSGMGGDEVFGGYPTFHSTPRLVWLAALARLAGAPVRATAATLMDALGRSIGRSDAARKLAAVWRDPAGLPHPYFYARALFTPDQVRAALIGAASPGPVPDLPDAMWWVRLCTSARRAKGLDGFAAVSYLETQSYLVNTLLRDTDAMSMAHSLEVRVPWLDHVLAEFVMALPEASKRGSHPKTLMLKALDGLLPDAAVRQRKRTFTFPWEQWLRGPLKARIEEELLDLAPPLRPFLDAGTVARVWQAFLDGRTTWSRPWSLYVLNEWARRHLSP